MRIAALLLAAALSACTLSNYGAKPIATGPDTWKFRMVVGGFNGADDADRAVKVDLDAFKDANGFKSYRLVNRQFNNYPSSYEYFVQFAR
jgi:hypothetical protein